jgi:hypothetical protein
LPSLLNYEAGCFFSTLREVLALKQSVGQDRSRKNLLSPGMRKSKGKFGGDKVIGGETERPKRDS